MSEAQFQRGRRDSFEQEDDLSDLECVPPPPVKINTLVTPLRSKSDSSVLRKQDSAGSQPSRYLRRRHSTTSLTSARRARSRSRRRGSAVNSPVSSCGSPIVTRKPEIIENTIEMQAIIEKYRIVQNQLDLTLKDKIETEELAKQLLNRYEKSEEAQNTLRRECQRLRNENANLTEENARLLTEFQHQKTQFSNELCEFRLKSLMDHRKQQTKLQNNIDELRKQNREMNKQMKQLSERLEQKNRSQTHMAQTLESQQYQYDCLFRSHQRLKSRWIGQMKYSKQNSRITGAKKWLLTKMKNQYSKNTQTNLKDFRSLIGNGAETHLNGVSEKNISDCVFGTVAFGLDCAFMPYIEHVCVIPVM